MQHGADQDERMRGILPLSAEMRDGAVPKPDYSRGNGGRNGRGVAPSRRNLRYVQGSGGAGGDDGAQPQVGAVVKVVAAPGSMPVRKAAAVSRASQR